MNFVGDAIPPGSQRNLSDLISGSARSELKRLEIKTRRVLDADLCGQYRSAFRGSGLVYADLREYQPGDEIKSIHWKISARAGKVYVKSYEEDRQLNLMLVIDISSSTLFGAARSKHAKAFEFAALIAMLAQTNGDSVGLCLFSDEVEEFLPPSKARTRFQRVILSLLQHRELKPASNLAGALEHILRHQKRRSVVFVVSDFLCPKFEEQLLKLSLKNDVVCVLLEDALDQALPSAGIVEFIDAESNELYALDTSSARVQRALEKLHQERLSNLRRVCLAAQTDLITIRDSTLKPLLDLMERRSKRSSRPSLGRVGV
jgi:uncharacterized protein (DUF58 family)